MNITIRKPTQNDFPALLSLWQGQYDYHSNLDPEYYVSYHQLQEQFKDYLQDLIDAKGDVQILVAEMEGRLLGFVTFHLSAETYFDTKIREFGEVLEIYVDERERQRGVGTLLMQAAEEYFRKQKVKYLKVQSFANNLGGEKFYPKIGYRKIMLTYLKKIS